MVWKKKQPQQDTLTRAHAVGTRALAVFADVEEDLMDSIDLLTQAANESADAISFHQARFGEANMTKQKNEYVLNRVRELTGQRSVDDQGPPA